MNMKCLLCPFSKYFLYDTILCLYNILLTSHNKNNNNNNNNNNNTLFQTIVHMDNKKINKIQC